MKTKMKLICGIFAVILALAFIACPDVPDNKPDQPLVILFPVIGDNGNWWIGNVDTGIRALDQGAPGSVVTIVGGYWYIDGVYTGVRAQGQDGTTPHIGSNGNWWIGNVDTGVRAEAAEPTEPEERARLVITPPSQTMYMVGEPFNAAGLKVRVFFTNDYYVSLFPGLYNLFWNGQRLHNGKDVLTK